MRPDRIVVGEVRSGEALDMLQAMNTGHSGSLTTVHANSPRDALARIETLVLMSGYDLDGSRRVTHITEVQGMEGDVVVTADLFAAGMGGGPIAPTGIRPRFEGDLAAIGVDLPADLFVDSAGR
jgi:pilus assembly protein CpaF